MQPHIYNGSRLTVSINDKVVAAGFVASYTIQTAATEIETVDIVIPVEIAPTRIRVNMSMQVYRTNDNDPVSTHIAPGTNHWDNNEQKAFTQAWYLKVEIKDDQDRTVFAIPRAVLTARSGSVSVGNFLTETWQIAGMGYGSSL